MGFFLVETIAGRVWGFFNPSLSLLLSLGLEAPMRRLTCLVTVVAAVLVIPMAQAVSGPAVSLSVSSFQVRYGDSLHLMGEVSNHRSGVPVGVFARSFSDGGFVKIATVTTGANGRWMHDAKPDIATTYQARTSGDDSRTLLVGVRPAVSLTQLDNGRLRVDVDASKEFPGKAVKVQLREAGAWKTLGQLRLNGKSAAMVPASLVPKQASALRATMSVNQAGQGFLGGFSTPLALDSRWVSLSTSASEVAFGEALKLTGRVSTREAGTPVQIFARPAATPEFQPLASLTSGAGGKWSYTTTPRIGTVYEAQSTGATSRTLGVGVHPTAKVKIIDQGRVWTQIGAYRSLAGKSVQMQQLVEGQWRTVAKAKLNGNSEAIFPATKLPGGTSTMRVAMSVNQAGSGYLGASSRTFVYQR
jgi:hypothetical protein